MIIQDILQRMEVTSRERKRWSRVSETIGENVRVFYGFDFLPTRNECASGGIVKFQDLQSVYPNTPVGANVIYFTSSALPPYAPLIASMAKKRGCRIVINQNGVAYPAWCFTGWKAQNRFMRDLLKIADYVFYQSNFCRLSADKYLVPFNGPAEILFNSVNTDFFVPAVNSSLQDPVTLLLSGSHCHYYRVACAIETVEVLKRRGVKIRLLIAGRYCWGSDEASALLQGKKLAVDRGVESQVFFSGAYSQDEAVALFQRADILLHTKYNDPCPRLVIEAMSCGLPVVYSVSGGMPELIGEEAGVGVSAPLDWTKDHPPAAEELADCVQSVIANYKTYSDAARKRAVKRFDSRSWIKRHQAVFENLVKA